MVKDTIVSIEELYKKIDALTVKIVTQRITDSLGSKGDASVSEGWEKERELYRKDIHNELNRMAQNIHEKEIELLKVDIRSKKNQIKEMKATIEKLSDDNINLEEKIDDLKIEAKENESRFDLNDDTNNKLEVMCRIVNKSMSDKEWLILLVDKMYESFKEKLMPCEEIIEHDEEEEKEDTPKKKPNDDVSLEDFLASLTDKDFRLLLQYPPKEAQKYIEQNIINEAVSRVRRKGDSGTLKEHQQKIYDDLKERNGLRYVRKGYANFIRKITSDDYMDILIKDTNEVLTKYPELKKNSKYIELLTGQTILWGDVYLYCKEEGLIVE